MEEKQKFSDRIKDAMLSQLKAKNTLMLITGLCILGAFLYLIYSVVNKPIFEANRDAFNILLGAVMGSSATLVTFYFGSSKSSSDKNELLIKKDEPKLP